MKRKHSFHSAALVVSGLGVRMSVCAFPRDTYVVISEWVGNQRHDKPNGLRYFKHRCETESGMLVRCHQT